MPKIRLLVTLAALVLGALATDVGVGRWLLARSRFSDLPLPPFGRLDAGTRRELRALLEEVRQGASPSPLQGFDADLGWCNRPGRAAGQGVSISRLGTRGEREYAPRPPQDALRLACYGTSFVFGSEVADDETFGAWLERLDPRIEALNLGVGGYGTDQALLRLRRDGLFGAQVAVLGLCLENIGRNVNRYRRLYSPSEGAVLTKPRFLLSAGHLVLLPQPFRDRASLLEAALDGELPGRMARHEYWAGDDPLLPASLIARVLAAGPAHRRRQIHRLWLEPEGEPYRLTLALVEAFRSEALERGASDVLVLVFARRIDIGSFRGYGRRYWEGLLEDLARRDIPHLDLATRLAGEPESVVYRRIHHSPAGNLIVAEEVLAWLAGRY